MQVLIFLQLVMACPLLLIGLLDIFIDFIETLCLKLLWQLKANESMTERGIRVVHLQNEFGEPAILEVPVGCHLSLAHTPN
jgi:hypothetical protein